MDYSKKLIRKLSLFFAGTFFIIITFSLISWSLISSFISDDFLMKLTLWISINSISIGILSMALAKLSHKPLKKLSDVIVFVGHSSRGGTAPNIDTLKIGREMVSSLSQQVYDLASMVGQSEQITSATQLPPEQAIKIATTVEQKALEIKAIAPNPSFIDLIGMPVIGIGSDQTIILFNRAASLYIGQQPDAVIGKKLYDIISFAFDSEDTFELWLKNIQDNAVTSTKVWERVRLVNQTGKALKQFDLVASFSKGNESGAETMLAIFDRTEKYSQDSSEVGFVALAVHELRTPLTIMRGYIEVFEDELGPTLNPEMSDFMYKMQASAQQLTAFVTNILNVARVEENQLILKLQQNNWSEILHAAMQDLDLRARVNGKQIELRIADNLPPVAVDKISIHEVLNNLVDNAIKYSGKNEKIVVTSTLNTDGLIETSVQDFGLGIPQTAMNELFQKFYRSHKSKSQVGGTGLGLFLCKAIVTAHGGNIWVHSREGQGSIFSFTIQAYDSVKHEQPDGQDGIMRGAHGWIKNHSLNRQ